jgi:hypothetical protein
MKRIILAQKTEEIVADLVPVNCGVVVAYIADLPYKLHGVNNRWAFIELYGSECCANGLYDSPTKAIQSILEHTTKLLYFDYFEEFITYHQNR